MPLAVTRSVLENAEGIFTVMTTYGRQSPKIEYRKATMLAAFSDNHRYLGQTRTAKHRLDEAQQILADLVRTAPSNSDYLFSKAQLHGKAGALLSTLGDLGVSVREYQARYEIMTRLAPTDPGKVDWHLELALSRISLVDTLLMRDVTATALQGYRELSRVIIERLAVAEPGNAKLQRQLGIALTNIGFSLWQQGNLEGAQDNFAKRSLSTRGWRQRSRTMPACSAIWPRARCSWRHSQYAGRSERGALPSAEFRSAIC